MKDEKQQELTHFNQEGRAKMVDVSQKESSTRTARAMARIQVNADCFQKIRDGGIQKGDVLAVAQLAGIMAAKKTPDLIPMCHTLLLSGVDFHFDLLEEELAVELVATVKCKGQTGVEMEALTAASVAALTIYDMCKAVQKDMVIGPIRLLSKTGGKSGEYHYED